MCHTQYCWLVYSRFFGSFISCFVVGRGLNTQVNLCGYDKIMLDLKDVKDKMIINHAGRSPKKIRQKIKSGKTVFIMTRFIHLRPGLAFQRMSNMRGSSAPRGHLFLCIMNLQSRMRSLKAIGSKCFQTARNYCTFFCVN